MTTFDASRIGPYGGPGPWYRDRGEILCRVCDSHRENEYWCCPTCKPHKPRVHPSARDGRTP